MVKKNSNLHAAKREQNNEFYTQLADIENELKHYTEHFRGKVVYCNCDDPRVSNFFHFFSFNFERLGLKKLISTCYKNRNMDLFSQHDVEKAVALIYEGDKDGNKIPSKEEIDLIKLEGDGDFRSRECIEFLKQADIVVTNPPFSLFREYVDQLVKYNKKFLIIGNNNAITYKEIFKLIKENKVWLGYNVNKTMEFILDKSYQKWDRIEQNEELGEVKYGKVPAISWYTNLEHNKRHEKMILVKKYKGNEKEYPKYDNYDAIEVSKVANIPVDYDGYMGVPITFLGKYNPEQFEIIGMSASAGYNEDIVGLPFLGDKDARPLISGKNTYARIFVKRKVK